MHTTQELAARVETSEQAARRARRDSWLPALLVGPMALYLAITLLAPTLVQIYTSFMTRERGTFAYRLIHRPTLDSYLRIVGEADLLQSLLFTVAVAFLIALASTALGLPVAQFLARGRGRGKLIVEMALLLPLFGDIFMAYALIYAFAPQGIVNWALIGLGLVDAPIRLANSTAGAVVAMLLPSLNILLIRGALARIDPVYEEAALMLGMGPVRAWLSTTFRLARTGIIGAFLLTFAAGIGAYTMPLILAGADNLWLSTKIAQVNGFNNIPLASALSIAITALSGLIIYLYLIVTRPRSEAERYVG